MITILQLYFVVNFFFIIKEKYVEGGDIIVDNNYDNDFFKISLYSIMSIISMYSVVDYYIKECKQNECVKSLIYYTFSEILLYNNLLNSEWYLNNNMIKNYQKHEITSRDKFLYILSLCYYIIELVQFGFKKIKRKDDTQMLIHHIVTIILIAISYHTNMIRIGLSIIYLFDMNDILLCFSKLLSYYKINNIITDTTFVFFFITWVYNRLYLYLVYVIYILYVNIHSTHEYISLYLLLSIYGLNLIWTNMIIQAGYRIIKGIKYQEIDNDYEKEIKQN